MNNKMKKFLTVFAIFALALAGCEEENNQTVTQLTVKNESRTRISHAAWNSFEFSERNPGGGIAVYNYYINVGGNMAGAVQPGTGYIYFRKITSSPGETLIEVTARTHELITVEADEQIIFTFTDSTVVVNLATNNTGTLGDLN